jgi:prepilin-type N-terminal cleavage/methylation domain-containing protein
VERERVNAFIARVRRIAAEREDRGFTLVELIMVVVVLAIITGAITGVFITALNGDQVTKERVAESSDAQLIAGYLERDAQAAGGTNPATGSADPTIGGVALADGSSCAGTGTPLIRFRWTDEISTATSHMHDATYYFDSSKQEVTRSFCTDGASSNVVLLADTVASASAACYNADNTVASPCPNMPDHVALTATATNAPNNATSPYTYTEQAFLRPQVQSAPSITNSAVAPLLTLSNCSGIDVSGNGGIKLTSPGTVLVDSACNNPIQTNGNGSFSTNSTLAGIGACTNQKCPPGYQQTTTPIPDPFSSLPAPSTAGMPTRSGCAGGTALPGLYTAQLVIGGDCTFSSGIYVFQNGLSLTSNGNVTTGAGGVLLYFAGGSLSATGKGTFTIAAMTTSTYANIAVFQARGNTTQMNLSGQGGVTTFSGTIYLPDASVGGSGQGGIRASMIVAQSVSLTGNGGLIAGPVTPPPSVTAPASLPNWEANVAYPSTTATATAGAGAYVWSASGMPNGLSIDPTTGVISGTPTASGTFNITITVTDALAATASKSYTVVINPALSITGPANLPDWTAGRAYPATTMTTSGGTTPITFSASNLPTGLSINTSTGQITGTPTNTGTFANVIVKATDGIGATATHNDSITINPAPSITTSSLPAASQGVAYNTTLAGTGGTPSITWSASPLPAGLSINASTGVISGTPTGSGTTNVNITLTDATGATANKTLALTTNIVPFNISSIVLGNANGVVGIGDTITINYGKAIAVNSLCSTWNGNATNQSITGDNQVTVTVTNNGTGNDTLTVASNQCGGTGFKFGVIDLGSPNWVSSTRSYSGTGGNASTITYNATTFALTIKLGTGTAGNNNTPAQTIVYTPGVGVTDTFGNTLASTTYSATNQRF